MKRGHVVVLAAALALLPAGLAAQRFPVDIGAGVGGMEWTRLLALSGGGGSPGFAAAPFVSGGVSWTPTLNWGVRFEGMLAPTSLRNIGSVVDPAPGAGPARLTDRVNVWELTASARYRFEPRLASVRRWVPYVGGVVGAVIVDPRARKTYSASVTDANRVSGVAFTADGRDWLLAREARLAAGFVAGVELPVTRSVAARAELGDRFFKAPVYALEVRNGVLARPQDAAAQGEVVHGLYVRVGVQLGLGQPTGETGVRAPQPAPRPTPRPEALPDNAEPVRFCAVDPTTAAGLRTLDGYYLPGSQDTVLVLDGRTRPLSEALRAIPTAARAEWYRAGQPLTIDLDGEPIRFVPYQGARRVPIDDLVYVGRAGGVPSFADRRDMAGPGGKAWAEAASVRPGASIAGLAADLPPVRETLSALTVLYLPLRASGCVFQPFVRADGGGRE